MSSRLQATRSARHARMPLSKELIVALVFLATVTVTLLLVVGDKAEAGPQGVWLKDAENPVLEAGPEGSWDQHAVYGQAVIKEGNTYKMWYRGYETDWTPAVGYATSADGVNWQKYAGNPVLSSGPAGSWDANRVYLSSVISDGTTYHMWYWAADEDWNNAIGHATSPDGVTWTKDPANPVLEPGPEGSWDCRGVRNPAVIQVGTRYEMWYQGRDADNTARIGHAVLIDGPFGAVWSKDVANPVIEGGGEDAWDASSLVPGSVLYDSHASAYRMWYDARGTQGSGFGYATSPDGTAWTKHTANPIILAGTTGHWDAYGISRPTVIPSGSAYEMWYSGWGAGGYALGHAVAEPGGWITGTVQDESSIPLEGARVCALDTDLNVLARAQTGADGRYALKDMPTDSYYVEARAEGYGREYYDDAPDTTGATSLSVTGPVTASDIDFTLTPGGTISGHVYGPDGKSPLANAMVSLTPAGGGRPLGDESSGGGAYAVEDLATSNYDGWAAHSSYLADFLATPVSVTQPGASGGVDFSLAGPYLPLQEVGHTYHYTWSNDVRHPDPIAETWQLVGDNWEGRIGHALSTRNEMTLSKIWFSSDSNGVSLNDWSIHAYGDLFPHHMVGIVTHLVTPDQVMKQPMSDGAHWSGPGWGNSQATSTIVNTDESITVTAGTFTNTLHIRTVITGSDDYLSGERETWFAPGVGLVKLVYSHDEGSVTTAELVGGPYAHHIHLPLVTRNYESPDTAFGEVIETIPAPGDNIQGLTWDGSSLWVGRDKIYKLDPEDGSVLQQFPTPWGGGPQGLAWDGTALWTVDYGGDRIYRVDPNGGAVLDSFSSPGSRPIGIAWDGTYLWNSDENGTFYQIDPSDGSMVGSFSSPLGAGTTTLDWDGRYLWASVIDNEISQIDTSNWQIKRIIHPLADRSKGIAWDGENIWNGGYEDDTLYLLSATPDGGTISGRVLNDGSPIAGKEMRIVKNSNSSNEMRVGALFTDGKGEYSFDIDPDVEYELRGYGDTSSDQLRQWVEITTPSASAPDVTLSDVDIYYDGLLNPSDGTNINRDQVNAGSPITFAWSPKDDVVHYEVHLRQHNWWSHRPWSSAPTSETDLTFDGTTTSGAHLPPMTYDWSVGMLLENGWWAWSGHHELEVTSTPLALTVDGDPSEWGPAVPIATDAEDDSSGGQDGTDLGSVYGYLDGSDIYLLIIVHDPDIADGVTIELNLDHKRGTHQDWDYADLHLNIYEGGLSAWVGDMEPHPITGAQVAFDEAMEVRIPRDQLDQVEYAVPSFVNIWLNGQSRDSLHILD